MSPNQQIVQLHDQTGAANSDHSSHGHVSPLRRFYELINLDRQDVWAMVLFSFIATVLSLASPLAVESLVNVVSWGISFQPLVVLAIILLVALSLLAILNTLQTVVVEMIQRRQFVRIVADLAYRFPRATRSQLSGVYPRELANRVFDIMTIQKATAVLLLDGISIILITLLGLLLLGFYHPFLLGFDLVLILLMTLFTWLLGWGGVQSSIKESATKYRVSHWLQDVIDTPCAFRVNGGEPLAIDKASRLASEYVQARRVHFRVLIRQIAFAAAIQAIALTVLLGLGGWLVIQGELTLGQLVASELVVTMVLSAFAKAGKSIEKFYDLMAGVDKVGHLLDLTTNPNSPIAIDTQGPLGIQWDTVVAQLGTQHLEMDACRVPAGSIVAIQTYEYTRLLMKVLTGLLKPKKGRVTLEGIEVSRVTVGCQQGQILGVAAHPKIFHGTVEENVRLGRSCIDSDRVQEALQQVGLWEVVANLPGGLDAVLQTEGFPLSAIQQTKLMIAQAIAAKPRVLLIESLLDLLPEQERVQMMKFLRSRQAECTTLIITRLNSLASQCDDQIQLES